MLCYKFADEPYKAYQNLRLSVYDLFGVATQTGEPTIIIADSAKTLHFNGWLVQKGDYAAWIPGDESECDAPTYAVEKAVDREGNATYTFPTPMEAFEWHLCYRFHDEPYRLFPEFTLTMRHLYHLSAVEGLALIKEVCLAKPN